MWQKVATSALWWSEYYDTDLESWVWMSKIQKTLLLGVCTKSGVLAVCFYTHLLELSQANLFTYCLWLLLHYKVITMPTKSKKIYHLALYRGSSLTPDPQCAMKSTASHSPLVNFTSNSSQAPCLPQIMRGKCGTATASKQSLSPLGRQSSARSEVCSSLPGFTLCLKSLALSLFLYSLRSDHAFGERV